MNAFASWEERVHPLTAENVSDVLFLMFSATSTRSPERDPAGWVTEAVSAAVDDCPPDAERKVTATAASGQRGKSASWSGSRAAEAVQQQETAAFLLCTFRAGCLRVRTAHLGGLRGILRGFLTGAPMELQARPLAGWEMLARRAIT